MAPSAMSTPIADFTGAGRSLNAPATIDAIWASSWRTGSRLRAMSMPAAAAWFLKIANWPDTVSIWIAYAR